MNAFTRGDLDRLRRLRQLFLSGKAGARDYWESREDLQLYDELFGERIGWKWDAALEELVARGWIPPGAHVLDWGCGSGIAGRRLLARWPEKFTTLALYDRSGAAAAYAAEKARADFPGVATSFWRPEQELPPGTVLVLSHVLNELPEAALEKVAQLAESAVAVIWVEAGAHSESRQLSIGLRDRLLRNGELEVVAPCTHRQRCGMATEANERHWCHSFAPVPSETFRSARWSEFSRELGIDLRSVPYSFLALSQRSGEQHSGGTRSIGRPRDYKGYSKVLTCDSSGVKELVLQKRDDPALLKTLQRRVAVPVYALEVEDGKIRHGEAKY